jgi:hypothetical protein
MEVNMDFIKKLVITFIYILAGITLSATTFITLFVQEQEFTIILLWQMIAMAAVCALGNFIYYAKVELSKKQMRIRMVCHGLYIICVVLGGAFFWEWLQPGAITRLLVMVLLIATVYISVTLGTIYLEKKTADSLNERLNKYHNSEVEKDN